MTRPEKGSPAHRDWVLASIRSAASMADIPIAELARDRFYALRPDDAADWPSGRDLIAAGGWRQVQALAGADQEPPSREELGERRSVLAENRYRQRLEREVGDVEWQVTRLRDALRDAVQLTPPVLSDIDKPPVVWESPAEYEVCALLSDLHYGSLVDPLEVGGHRYDWQIAARRTGFLAHQIATWKPHHRDRARLRLVLGGDVIESELHGRGPHIDYLAEQVDGARQILTDLIDYLRQHYAAIEVSCATGNHGRQLGRATGRATDGKFDSLESVIYRGLEAVFRHCPDVRFSIPRTPWVEWEAPGGQWAAFTHGDTVLGAGNPNGSIQVARIASKVRQWNASRHPDRRLALVAMGHHHFATDFDLDEGVRVMVNGSLIGLGPYANSLGVFGNMPTQWIFESVPGHVVGDARKVRVALADHDAHWESICRVPTRIGEVA